MVKNNKLEKEVASVITDTKTTTQKFSIEKLRENCLHIFAISTSTFDGATLHLCGEYSIEEIKSTLTKWGENEVK